MNRNRTSSIPQPGLARSPPRPVYNDSFNQPDEPFECDLSAIYPQNDDDLSISDTEDYQDDSMCSSSFQETTGHHDAYRQPTHAHTHTHTNTSSSHNHSQPQNHPQDALHSRYLEVESASWTGAHQDEEVPEGGDFEDEEEEEEEDDQFLGGGRARLSTIAELSELPSINFNHNHHNNLRSHYNHNNPHRTPSALATTHNTSSSNNNNNTSATGAASNSRRLEPAQSGHLVISRDLVLEDLFVEGQEEAENAEEEVRQQLMANLKPTDILGPLHETRDFQLSSLTGPGRQWERQDQHVPQDEEEHPDDQDMEDDDEDKNSQHDSFVREDGESDLSSTALALKREYEALFGSKGAVDSERSGSDANGLLGYDNSDDLYPRGDDDEDDDDDFFGDEDDEDDEAEEEFYAMLDLNGGVGNMILGNNIPRKPRALAPPPGSRLPVPGSANKEKVPLALQSKIVSRVPVVRSPLSSASASPSPSPAPSSPAPVQSVSRIVPPTTGLRLPQVAAKRGPESMSSLPTPSTSATTPKPTTQSTQQPSNTTVSILDGLWKEQEYDSQPEESPGAIFAAKVAKELMKEKQESLLAAQAAPRTSLLKPRLKLPSARSTVVMPEGDVERLTNMLKIEEAPAAARTPTTTSVTHQQSMLVAPTPVSKLVRPSIVPPRVRSVASPIPPRSLTGSPVRAPSKSPIPPSSSGSSPRSVATYTKSRAEAPASGQRSGTVTPKNPSKAASFVKEASMDESVEQQERPQELARRQSAERKRHLQRELELIEAEEAEEAAAAAEAEEKIATPRKLSVRTSSEPAENRRSKDLQQSLHRRSSERERERGSVPTSPLSPLSPLRSGGISSKRSSLYDMNGERKVPSLEESCKQLAKIRQDIVELREEIYQDQPGTSFPSPTSAGPRASTAGKRPSGRDRDRDRETHSRHNSLENKPQNGTGGRETRPQLGRSDSHHNSAPSSPEVKVSTRRHFFGDILGKLSRNSLHVSTSGPAPSSALTGQQQPKTSPTFRKSQASGSQSHPIKPMSRSMIDSEQPAATVPRTPTTAYPGGRSSTTYRHSTHQPMSPVASRDKQMGYEDRYHSGSSGQSTEFYDEPAYYPASANNNPYKQPQSSMSASHRARQQQQQQQRQLGSNQTSHHFRQAHDGSLILSDSPPFTSAMTDGMEFGSAGCPAQIRPKELRFSNSVAGEIQSTVTLSNRSNRTMHYEILRPAGISVSPSFGMIQPGRDQRLTVHLAENRGPGRVVVELDGEWLVPFGISFD